jgi:tetratricopeptide (TPR) repeat protein
VPHILQIISTIVAAIVAIAGLGWFVLRTLRRSPDPAAVIFKWLITIPLAVLCFFSVHLFGTVGPFVIVVCAVILSYLWTPHIGALVSKPLTSIFDGGDVEMDPEPAYSIARSRQKQGKYLEAVALIRQQLDRFPNDVEGQMLLAQIQAEDLKDMQGTELTIQRFCAQSGHAPRNLAFALYSLADWQLKIGQDRDAAQRALEQIIELCPDTEFALGAAQRIAHLCTAEMLLSPHERRKFTVTPGIQNLGLLKACEADKAAEADEGKLAAEYVKHLENHPLDTDVREKLAVIYAGHYSRLDLAMDQLEQMIQQPNQPPRLVVRWLNLMADLQIRAGVSYEAIQQTLQRIIDLYPSAASAEIARNRMGLVKLEMKVKEKNQAVKMGTYEQNIGLKGKRG